MKFNRISIRLNSAVCLLLVLLLLVLSACGEKRQRADASYEFQKCLLDSAALLREPFVSDVKEMDLDSIQYGSFSSPTAKEICVLFKYRSMSHVGGLDRTLAVIFAAEDLQVVASSELAADDVQIRFLPSKDGTYYILYVGTTTYQGLSTYNLQLFRINGSTWEPMPEAVPPSNVTDAYFLVDDSILYRLGEDLREIYVWNSDAGRFEYRSEF